MYGFAYILQQTVQYYGGMNGSSWHLVWIWFSKIFCVAPLTTIVLSLVAWNSYGS